MRRWRPIVLLLLLISPGMAAARETTDLIELSLGFGFGFPPDSGLFLETGGEAITLGPISDDLIRRIFIQRPLLDQLLLELDYDSAREGGFLTAENIYSLQYLGLEGEYLREASAGNRLLSIPGTRLLPIDEGNRSSYALRAVGGSANWQIDALLRYSQAMSGSKRFRGSSRLVESEHPDTGYARKRFFFLPDAGIDEASLLLRRGSTLLARNRDYTFDNSRGWISLSRSLYEKEELLVYYEDKGGSPVGSFSLGPVGMVDTDGVRKPFNSTAFPGYFTNVDGRDYLYLHSESFDSYWQLKNAYYLEEVGAAALPETVEVSLRLTATGELNTAYDLLLGSYFVDPARGTLHFTFSDGTAFYPRPFPAAQPYDPLLAPYADDDPRNPFDPDHPIYGRIEPESGDSVNTIVARYAVSLDSYFLDFDLIEGSVRVSLDGVALGPSLYTVDYASGVISFAPGVIGPTSDIEVSYRYTPLAGGAQDLLLALGLGYTGERFTFRNLTSFSYPLTAAPAPQVGEERASVLGNSSDLILILGAGPGEAGLGAELKAGAALTLTRGNHRGLALLADMEQAGPLPAAGADTWLGAPRQVSGAEDPLVEANLFSDRYPELYADLHGSASQRLKSGQVERVLVCDFDATLSPLSDGGAALLGRSFGRLVDFSAYRELRLYLFLPVGQTLPAQAAFQLILVGSAAERLEAVVAGPAQAGTKLEPGWNEITVGLDPPYPLSINGSAAGVMSRSGSLSALSRIAEVRFGVLAQGGELSSAFSFWTDEWHLAGSRYELDLGAYAETSAGYRGGLLSLAGGDALPFLRDPLLRAAFEHREGRLLGAAGRQRSSWSGGLEATLLQLFPIGVEVSGFNEIPGGLFRAGQEVLPGAFREQDSGLGYSHRLGVDTGLAFLPLLQHRYQRSRSEGGEVSLSASGYQLDARQSVRESLSLAATWLFPEGLEQSYSYSRSWLYTSLESVLADLTPVSDSAQLLLQQAYAGALSYSRGGSFLSLELSRAETYALDDPPPPPGLAAAYADRLSGLFQPLPGLYPEAEERLRSDRGAFNLSLPRQHYLGASVSLEGSFNELNFDPSAGSRDLALKESLALALPFSPLGRGILELTPRLSRSYSASFGQADASIEELRLLAESWGSLLRPPLYYLNPFGALGRRQDYEVVDLLAASTRVAGGSAASLASSLGLEARLKGSPWYLPSRFRVTASGETAREGESYRQDRSLELTLGTDFQRPPQRLSLDAGWKLSRDYRDKIVAHTVFLDTGLRLGRPARGQLAGSHHLSFTRERQRPGEPELILVPGHPELEPALVPRTDRDLVESLLVVEYSRERDLDAAGRAALLAARLGAEAGRISHSQRLELENSFLLAERSLVADGTLLPLRLKLAHRTLMTVSGNLSLELDLKVIAGIEETISAGSSDFQPALGCELRLTAILTF